MPQLAGLHPDPLDEVLQVPPPDADRTASRLRAGIRQHDVRLQLAPVDQVMDCAQSEAENFGRLWRAEPFTPNVLRHGVIVSGD